MPGASNMKSCFLVSRAATALVVLALTGCERRTAPGWQGYLSSPAKATAAHGRAVEAWLIDGTTELMLRAVRGENLFGHPRLFETVPPAVAPMLEKALANEAAFEAKLEAWLKGRRNR